MSTVGDDKFCTNERFAEIFDHSVKSTLETARSNGGVELAFYIHGHNAFLDEWALMPALLMDWPPPGITTKRDALRGVMANFYREMGRYFPVCIVQVSEAWGAKSPNDSSPQDVPEGWQAEDQPDRRELLIIDAHTYDGRHKSAFYEMIRNDKGELTDFKLYDDLVNAENYLVKELYRAYADIIRATKGRKTL